MKYTELQDRIDELNQKLTDSRSDIKLSAQGKDAARVKYGDEIRTTRAELEELIRRTSQSFSEVRKDVDRFFGDLYRVSPDKLDTNALELLRSDILSDTELIDMAEKYADNTTMRRLIGKYAQERADKDRFNENMRRLAQSLNHHELLHLEAADTLIYWNSTQTYRRVFVCFVYRRVY